MDKKTVELIEEALDLIPRMSEEDPIAPALQEWTEKAKEAVRKESTLMKNTGKRIY